MGGWCSFCTNLNCDLILDNIMGFCDLCVTKPPSPNGFLQVLQLEISDVFRCFPNKPSCNALLDKLNITELSELELFRSRAECDSNYSSRGSMQVQPRHFGGLQYIKQDFPNPDLSSYFDNFVDEVGSTCEPWVHLHLEDPWCVFILFIQNPEGTI